MQIGGIDANQIVTSLMQIEERPLLVLQSRKDDASTAVDAIGRIRTAFESFRLAANRLADIASFSRFKATVSHPDALSATVSGAAFPSSFSFSVQQLAQSHGLRSVGTVASESIPITDESVLAVAAGTGAIGIDTVRAGTGLGVGVVTVDVIQSSTGAASVGTAPMAASTTINNSNNTIKVTVNGTAHNVTIPSGTYDRTDLTQAVQDALTVDGAAVDVFVDASGTLSLNTTFEGSTASIEVTGGKALSDLGLAIDAAAHVGADGIIDVDGTITTVTQAIAGQTVAVDTGAGTLDLVLSGGLRVGTSDVEVVSTGDRTLAGVAAAINSTNAGVGAAAVHVGTNQWRLQLSSAETGVDGKLAIDGSVFTGIGGLIESSAARNARLRIGDGAGAYDVEASGNTFTDVISGVTLTAKAVTSAAVTVNVERNDDAVADDVAKLVTSANALLAEIKVQTRYDATTGASGSLSGNGAIRRLSQQVRDALVGPVVGVPGVLASTAGIQLAADGSFTFDKATFVQAAGDDPTLIARLFGRGGTETGDAVFAAAAATTVEGAYDVEITTAATRATSALMFDWGAGAAARVGVRIGAITATFDVTAGQTAAQIIDGLNAAIAGAGLDVVAEADGGGLRLRGDAWGSAGDFELNDDVLGAGVWTAHTGTDVAGTIDGVVAAGSGRRLRLDPLADSNAAGLQIDIAGGALGSLGAVEYQPGLAARAVELATALTADEGALTSVKDFAERRVTDFADQITRLEDRLVVREVNLRRQWSNLQTLLSGLQNQGDWVTSQLASLNTNWSGS